MSRLRKAIAAATVSICSLLLPTQAEARDPCYSEGTCVDEEQIPPTQPPTQPPGPGGPPTPPPTSGIRTSLAGAFDMSPAGSNQQIYTVGWASAPNGYHEIWANDALQDGIVRFGGYHKLMTLEAPDPLGNAKIMLVKSPQGLGEIFRFTPDALRIELELMDWHENSWYRVLKDEMGRPGLMWARLNIPTGQYAVDTGQLDYYRCEEPRGPNGPSNLFEQHTAYAMNRLHGPFDISTSEGMAAARATVVSFMGNRDNPSGVPDAWKTFGAQLGHPNAHSMLYVMEGLWGPRDSRPIIAESHWGNKEAYAYIEAVEPDNSWRRGLGLVYWGALDEPDYQYSGNWVTYRQHAQTTVVQDGRTRMLELCEEPRSGKSGITQGLSMVGGRYRDEPFLIPEGIDAAWVPDAPWRRRPKWMEP